MHKKELRPLLEELLQRYTKRNYDAFFQGMEEMVLTQKISIPTLEFIGNHLFNGVGKTTSLEMADRIIEMGHQGGYVIAATILQRCLPSDFPLAFGKAEEYILQGNDWYACDKIAERVFASGLKLDLDRAIRRLTAFQTHENQWLQRSVGISVHVAAKMKPEPEAAQKMFELLLKQAKTRNFQVKKGVGLGIESLAKIFPSMVITYQTQIEEDPEINIWIKKKLVEGLGKGGAVAPG